MSDQARKDVFNLPEEEDDFKLQHAQITPAEVDDLPSICFFDESMNDPQRKEWLTRCIFEEKCWVLLLDDTIVAYMVVEKSFFDHHLLRWLFVHPDHRRDGIAEDLVEHLELLAMDQRVFASVPESNTTMRRVLERQGWKLSGTLEHLEESGSAIIYYKNM